jgi:hypothetical protein
MAKPKTTVSPEEAWSGPSTLRGLLVRVSDLTADPRNARLHDDRSYDAIAASLRQFGQRKPIVVDGTKVVAGNGQLEAARRLGWTHLAVTDTEGLTPEQVRAYALADNRTAELSEWNVEVLLSDLSGLDGFDVGFSKKDVADLMRSIDMSPAVKEEAPKPSGQFWQLGRHELHCIDSAQEEARQGVLRGRTVDVTIMDPPYDLPPAIWHPLITDPSIIFGRIKGLLGLREDLVRFERVILKKNAHSVMTVYMANNHSVVLQYGSDKIRPPIGYHSMPRSVFDDRTRTLDSSHPHEKPIALLCEHLQHWTPRGDGVVVDWFAGSGSGLLACEMQGRTWVGAEMDPARCAEIAERFEIYRKSQA